MTNAVAAGPVRTGRHANTSLVVLFLSLGGLAFAVLQSLVAPALPVIARELHASTDAISWVLTAYLLSVLSESPLHVQFAGGFVLIIPSVLFIFLVRKRLFSMWGIANR